MHRISRALANEAFAGALLLASALLALIWANSPWQEAYAHIAHAKLGWGDLTMSVSHWTADGLLAIFFFVVGLELKHEVTRGSLRDPRTAAVPVIAACAGVAAPAAIYVAFQGMAGGDTSGWAIPVATDIAFALAVLAIFGRGLPSAARTFLMTLAVADDLLAILIIAIFFSSSISLGWLAASAACIAAFGLAAAKLPHRGPLRTVVLLLLAAVAWAFMYFSGIHATIAGVALGFTVSSRGDHPQTHEMVERIQPLSAGLAMPLFAFFAAGVTVGSDFGALLANPVAAGVYVGLPLGKCLGIMAAVLLATRLGLRLEGTLKPADILPVSLVAGIGFTVSLLIAQLSFPEGTMADAARIAVLVGTGISAVAGAVALRLRSAALRRSRAQKASRRAGEAD